MIPVNLELKNFFSHKDSSIDFSQFDSALLIGNVDGDYDVSNGSGKSAVFESILWCLFNKSRVASQDDVIFWGENLCEVDFTFKHSGELYRVVRKRNRSNSQAHVTFYRQDSLGNWIDISGSTSSLTNSEIIKTIKFDYKTFVNSAYFRQNDISEFSETDASRRKEILKSIIDISKWDEYEEKVKSDLKVLRGESKILHSKIEGYELLVSEQEESKLSMTLVENELTKCTNDRNILIDTTQNMTLRYQELKDTLDTNQWDITTELLVNLNKELISTKQKLNSSSKIESEYKNIAESKNHEIIDYQARADLIKFNKDVDEQIKVLGEESIDLKAKLSSSESLLVGLNKREITKGQCYVCQQSIDEDLYGSLVEEHNHDISEHKRKKVYAQNKLNEIADKLTALNIAKSNNKKLETYLNKVSALTMELKIAEDRVAQVSKEKEDWELKEKSIINDISINEGILNSIRNDGFRDLQKDLFKKKEELKGLSDRVEKLNRDFGVLTEKVSNLNSRIEEMRVTKDKYLEKQKEMSLLEKMVRLLGKNGIQTILLNAVIEDLEKTSNEILTSICNEEFTVFLDTQRLHSDGVSIVDTLDLRVKKDHVVQNFKSLSGGEQFRISLAMRIALSEISSRHGGSSLEFLLLDEINSPLDRKGTESLFANVIRALEKKYKILVITHNDTLKEKFGDILDVTKINGESTVNYTSI